MNEQPVGIVGGGSFGTAVATLLAENRKVLLYSRREEVLRAINIDRKHFGVAMPANIEATSDVERLCGECALLFPIVSSENFRTAIQQMSPYLRPYHLLIHGTKGFDTRLPIDHYGKDNPINREEVFTMSEVITQESSVVRVGCLSGPNLAAEILQHQPAAAVIASKFDEVVKAGADVLRSDRFQVFGSRDIRGAELAGALKNIIAIVAGILGGMGYGQNTWAVAVTRGWVEMIKMGFALGGSTEAFLGLAGIGDLIATTSSRNSRNYTMGLRLASGEKIKDMDFSKNELAEGIRTLKIAKRIADSYKLPTPIIQLLYRVCYRDFDIKEAINFLMTMPYTSDVDFLPTSSTRSQG